VQGHRRHRAERRHKVKWVPLNAQQRFAVLQSGEIDVLSRNTTWTLTRDASLGLHFTGVTYYDGQGFMVPKKSKITSAKQLKGATVCVQSGTTTEKNLTDYSKSQNLNIKPVVFDTQEATNKAYFAGRCQAYTTDASGLASVRNKEAGNPDDHVILPELISKEPLGPSVRRGDDEFFAIVKWVVFALIEAEEYGITQANVDQLKADSKDPVVQRILGTSGRHRQAAGPGQGLGLPRHQGRGQLRRDLRAQRRPEERAEAAARRQQPVEQGRLHVRPAGPMCAERQASGLATRPWPAAPGPPDPRRRLRRPCPLAWASNCGLKATDDDDACSAEKRRWTWRSQEFRGVVYQVLALLLLAAALAYLLHNTLANMRARGIQSGFDFFSQPAGFAIGESLMPFDSSDSYAKAYAVGLSNTLRVALVGIVGATCWARWWASAGCRATRSCAACAAATSSSRATSRCCCSCSCGTSC
jgi:hypothetical protein